VAYQSTKFEAIGTGWEITLDEEVEYKLWIKTIEKIYSEIDDFDKAFSRFRPDSLVTQMSHAAGTYQMPKHGHKLLEFYERLYKLTDGVVTALIGQVMADAGYDANYSFKSKELKTPPKWQDALSYDNHQIVIKKPALLDFGAAGKGLLVDIVAAIIEDAGIKSFTINASGDILHTSEKGDQITVGLENPFDASEAIGVVKLGSKSLCASAGSKRKWHNFHHIIDPATLKATTEIVATWVIADDTMTADGLATALFFVNPSTLAGEFSFDYAKLGKDMELSYSPNFKIKIFETQSR